MTAGQSEKFVYLVKRLLRAVMARMVRIMWLRRVVAVFTRRMPGVHARLVAMLPTASIRSHRAPPNPYAPADGVEARLAVDARQVYRALQRRISGDQGSA